jgi:hypothetical protein
MENIFLVLSLFVPRISLILFYLINSIPYNHVPLIGDALLTIFLPRALILIYIVENYGTESPWFWIHLIVAVLIYIATSNKASKRKLKKNKIYNLNSINQNG